jgi:uncharacterized protein with HEPN domain
LQIDVEVDVEARWPIKKLTEEAFQEDILVRNRIAHGYCDINLDMVWDTVRTALPELLKQLPAVRQNAEDEDQNGMVLNHD